MGSSPRFDVGLPRRSRPPSLHRRHALTPIFPIDSTIGAAPGWATSWAFRPDRSGTGLNPHASRPTVLLYEIRRVGGDCQVQIGGSFNSQSVHQHDRRFSASCETPINPKNPMAVPIWTCSLELPHLNCPWRRAELNSVRGGPISRFRGARRSLPFARKGWISCRFGHAFALSMEMETKEHTTLMEDPNVQVPTQVTFRDMAVSDSIEALCLLVYYYKNQ